MSDGTFRGRWMDEVFRTSRVSAEVQVFLLFLGCRYMGPDGRISEPRWLLAEGLGCYERRINDRFESAIQGGLMERVSRGQKGRTAVYQATMPGAQRAGSPPAEHSTQGAGSPPTEDVQRAGVPHSEAKVQGASRPPAERPTIDVQGAGSPPAETGPIYKDRAHAHSRGDRSSTTAAAEADDSRRGAVVVRLFDEEIEPSLRSQTPVRASAPASEDDHFAAFWDAYPRRVGKGAARKAFAKAVKNGADPAEIIWGARRYSTDPRRAAADIRYTAHPATWLNAERWTDEDAPAPEPLAADPRQQATNDLFDRAMQRARAMDAMEQQ